MRVLAAVLLGLLALAQAGLWFGKGSLPHVMTLQQQLQAQQAVNAAARARNERLLAEVEDLRAGLEIIEERARAELGMVREHEVLVQVSGRR